MKKNILSAGFTIVELLVSVALIGIISAVLVWSHTEAVNKITIANAVNEVSVLVREAQVFGVGVRVAEDSSGGIFNVRYGVFGELDDDYIILFADKDNDGEYDGDSDCDMGPTEECLEKKILDRVVVNDLCGMVGSNVRCRADVSQLEAFTVTFKRPTPQAEIAFLNPGGQKISSFTGERIQIKLQSTGGLCDVVTVSGLGQVTTTDSC